MNLLLFQPSEALARHHYALPANDRRVLHLKNVLKLAIDEEVEAGVMGGNLGRATLIEQKNQQWHFLFNPVSPPPQPLNITLILALPRPKMLRRVLIDAITLGIKHIILINSHKVEKSYWQTPRLQDKQLNELVRLSLEQAKDTQPPLIEIKKRFKPFIEDELVNNSNNKRCYLLHPGNNSYLPTLPAADTSHAIIAIGPEGGWNDYEVARFIEAGFSPFSLGQRILRVETAVPAAVGRLTELP